MESRVVWLHPGDETATDVATLEKREVGSEPVPGDVKEAAALKAWLRDALRVQDLLVTVFDQTKWASLDELFEGFFKSFLSLPIESFLKFFLSQPIKDIHARLPHEQAAKRQRTEVANEGARERAFGLPYQNTDNISTMHDALTCIMREEGYAPTAGIFQSSGWGKSRLVCEFWQKEIWVVYCSFAAGNGYPKKSWIADWFCQQAFKHLGDESLEGQLSCMNFSLAYFLACTHVLQEHTNKSYAGFVQELISGGDDYWRKVQAQIMRLEGKFQMNGSMTKPEGTDKQLTWDSWEKQANVMVSDYKGKGFLMRGSEKLKLLFVFDESRHLVRNQQNVNCFLPIRRATRPMARSGALVLFMDTSSEISNFASPEWADPSDRVAGGVKKLAPPIWGSFSADISHKDSLPISSSKTLSNIVRNYWAVKYGRPLWSATFQSFLPPTLAEREVLTEENMQSAFEQARDLARDKLLGGSGQWDKYIFSKERLSEEGALALLGASIGLDVNPRSKLASKLVANHLLTVVSVSPTREQVWTAWSPEPLVAMVGAQACHTLHKASRSSELYQPLVDGLAAGWIDRGYKGELVARIILLHAVNEASLDHESSSNHCTVDAFLRNLVGKSLRELRGQELNEKEQKLANAQLHFNSFQRIHKELRDMTFADMLGFMERGCALICAEGTWGVDFLIFAFTGNDNDELAADNTTVIYCQVKLREKDIQTNVCLAKCSPQYAQIKVALNLPYLSLYLNVFSKEKSGVHWVDPKDISSSVERCTAKPITEALKQMEDEELMDSEGDLEGRKPSVLAWTAWLKARAENLQIAVVVKGLDAFTLDDDLKHQLKLVGKASQSPFCTDPKNNLHKQLLKIQKPRLQEMFKIGNLCDQCTM